MSTESATWRRIKRHLIGSAQRFFAVTPPGLENLSRREIRSRLPDVRQIQSQPGGVSFEGRLTDCYLAHLRLRTPVRILMRVARFRATHFDGLQEQVGRIPWELYVAPDSKIEVHVSARHSRLYHKGAVAERVAQAVNHKLQSVGSACPDPGSPAQGLWVRLENDRATLSLDASGDPLYRRGLQAYAMAAPLRENLAAAILQWAGYTASMPLVDGMCGSGTFSREAALMACGIPPGYWRTFAFQQWPAFKVPQWRYLKQQATEEMDPQAAYRILATDINPEHCRNLERFAGTHDWASRITVRQTDFFQLTPRTWTSDAGLVIFNPPYGRRLADRNQARQIYQRIGQHLARHYQGWTYAAILPDPGWARFFGGVLRNQRLAHGGLHARVLIGKIA